MGKWLPALLIATLALFHPMAAMAEKVVVDAGHGGSDPGAIGNGLREKDVNFDIAMKLRDELVKRGYDVAMSRTTDDFVSLQDRVTFTNLQNADIFVSIHSNYYGNPNSRGTMVLYYDNSAPQSDYPASTEMEKLTPESQMLAQDVLTSFVSEIGTEDKGLIKSAVYVVRRGTIPSILVETGFLSNTEDAALLADPDVRERMAIAIADGIAKYKPPVFVDTYGHWARDAILRLKAKGIVEGENNRFVPERALTRAEFTAMVERAFPLPTEPKANCTENITTTVTGSVYGEKPCADPKFKDLPATHWASDLMNKAAKLGIIDGYEDGTIRPDMPISRQEAAVLLDRTLKLIGTYEPGSGIVVPPLTTWPFTDLRANAWSGPAVARLKSIGVVDGTAEHSYAPERSITRAEIAVMIDRCLTKLNK